MGFEAVEELVATARSVAERLRRSIAKPETRYEQMLQVELHQIASMLESLGELALKARCAAEKKGGQPPVARATATWLLMTSDGEVMLVRTKPATTIALRGGVLVFARDHVRLEASGSSVKLCKWKYCKEIPLPDTRKALDYLPQLTYLVREVGWHVTKTVEGFNACLKKEAPECLRV